MVPAPRRVVSSTIIRIISNSLSMLALLCTSVRLTQFNCCHSCWQSQSSGFGLYCVPLDAGTLLDHTTLECFHNVFLQHLQEQLKIFECCAFAMNCSRKRFSTRSSTDQDHDFCTLLTLLDCCVVKVCSFRHCLSWVRFYS